MAGDQLCSSTLEKLDASALNTRRLLNSIAEIVGNLDLIRQRNDETAVLDDLEVCSDDQTIRRKEAEGLGELSKVLLEGLDIVHCALLV